VWCVTSPVGHLSCYMTSLTSVDTLLLLVWGTSSWRFLPMVGLAEVRVDCSTGSKRVCELNNSACCACPCVVCLQHMLSVPQWCLHHAMIARCRTVHALGAVCLQQGLSVHACLCIMDCRI
jgi:hypothetical protein